MGIGNAARRPAARPARTARARSPRVTGRALCMRSTARSEFQYAQPFIASAISERDQQPRPRRPADSRSQGTGRSWRRAAARCGRSSSASTRELEADKVGGAGRRSSVDRDRPAGAETAAFDELSPARARLSGHRASADGGRASPQAAAAERRRESQQVSSPYDSAAIEDKTDAHLDHRRRGARDAPQRPARQDRDHADQAADHPARPVARLFAGRRRALPRDPGRSGQGLRVHRQGQPRRGDLERHRGARASATSARSAPSP